MRTRLTLVFLIVALLGGCGVSPAVELREHIAATQRELSTTLDQLHQQQAASTQPGSTVPPPPPEAVKVVEEALKEVNKAAAAAATLPPDPDLGDLLKAIAPYAGKYGGWLLLAGGAISWIKRGRKLATSIQAQTATTDSLREAVNAGAITVQPEAVRLVNAAVPSTRQTDRLVNVLSDAAKTPRIPGEFE